MDFIQQAYKGKNKLWMFLVTSVVVSGIFILNFVMYLMTSPEDMDAAYDLIKDMPANLSLVVNLAPFVILLALLFFFVRFIHERSILSLTTARSKVDWKRIFFSFGLICTVTVVLFLVSYYIDSSNIEVQFNPGKFLILFVISILLFPFQIGLEEYLFRGYFMQQIGIMAKNRWVPLLLTSVFFGLAHSANPEVAEMGFITMVFYIGTGLFLGIITLMDDSLELALGFHLGNNLLAALLVTSDWSALQTDAIFKYTSEAGTHTFADVVAPVLIFYPLLILVFSRKYKWANWNEKLFGSVTRPIDTPIEDLGKATE